MRLVRNCIYLDVFQYITFLRFLRFCHCLRILFPRIDERCEAISNTQLLSAEYRCYRIGVGAMSASALTHKRNVTGGSPYQHDDMEHLLAHAPRARRSSISSAPYTKLLVPPRNILFKTAYNSQLVYSYRARNNIARTIRMVVNMRMESYYISV